MIGPETMLRLVAVSRSGRYAAVRDGDGLWIDDSMRGPRAAALPCDGDFAFAGDELWVSHGGALVRYALPSLEQRERLEVAAEGVLGDGEQILVRTTGGWLAQFDGRLEPIETEPGERLFPIGHGRRVHAPDGSCVRVVGGDTVYPVELGGPVVFAAPGLGRGWLALVDRGLGRRELVVVGADHRVVRRIGVATGAAMRSAAAGGRALVVTGRGQLLVIDLHTGAISGLESLVGERVDVACDASGRRVVAATYTPGTSGSVAIQQSVLAAA